MCTCSCHSSIRHCYCRLRFISTRYISPAVLLPAGDVGSPSSSQDSFDILSSQPRRIPSGQVHPELPVHSGPPVRPQHRAPAPLAPHEEPITSWSQLPDEALELIFAHIHPGVGHGTAPTLTQRQV